MQNDLMKYTVVLLRPDYMAEQYGTDIYVAYVKARDIKSAVAKAQKEVYRADKKYNLEPGCQYDYALCVAFEDHPKVARFGWQS